MDLDNINDEQYKLLYNRIKTDLYNEFINPETATYGLDVIRQQEAKEDKSMKQTKNMNTLHS